MRTDSSFECFKLLLDGSPPWQLFFVGSDGEILQTEGSAIYYDEFCDSISATDFFERIDFLSPMINGETPKLRLSEMVTVVASCWDYLGYMTLEARYQRYPVVCCDAGGCAEIIDRGRTGLLARSGDLEDFAEKIAVMHDSPDLADNVGLPARADMVANNPAKNIAERLAQPYDTLIADHRARSVSE